MRRERKTGAEYGPPGQYDTLGPYSGPSPERGQDRDRYQDGDRTLSDKWRDMPYADTEPPHPDADPRKDAPPAKRRTRLRFDDIAREAATVLAQDEADEAERAEMEALRWDDAQWGSDAWRVVAPYVDAVLNLMQGCENAGDLMSRLKESGAPDARMVLQIVKVATKFGFGFRETPKWWTKFQELVPAVAGLLKDENSRFKLKSTLQRVADSIKRKVPFQGLQRQPEAGFEEMTLDAPLEGYDPTDPLQVYEEAVPGEVPELESRNVKRILRLYENDPKLSEEFSQGLSNWRIIDFDSGKLDTSRLQTVLRYIIDRPTAPEAPFPVVGVLVREALSHGARDAEELFESAGKSGRVELNISPEQILHSLSGGGKEVVNTWLSIASSALALTGKLPQPQGDDGESTPQTATQRRLALNAASIAIGIAEKMLWRMVAANRTRIREEVQAIRQIRELALRAVDKKALGPRGRQVFGDTIDPAIEGMREAVKEGDAKALAESANEMLKIVRDFVRDESKVAPLERAVESLVRLLESPAKAKAASNPVADIAKRIVAPAKHRVVTREDAEGGIEVGDDELKLPSRYHSVSQALGVR